MLRADMQSGAAPEGVARRRGRRAIWLGLALVLGGVALGLGSLEPPLGTGPRPSPRELRWWVTPIERDAERNLAAIDADLLAVSAVDARHVWVAGRKGTIARSDDGGLTWTREIIEPPREPRARREGPEQGPVGPQLPDRALPAREPFKAPLEKKEKTKKVKEPDQDLSRKGALLEWLIPSAHAAEPPPAAYDARDQVQQPAPLDIDALEIVGLDARAGTAFATGGTALVRREGRWVIGPGSAPQSPPPRAHPLRGEARGLNEEAVLDDKLHGFGVGDDGLIEATDDGGRTWRRLTRPGRQARAGGGGRPTAWPMPLSWLLFGLGLVALVPGLRRIREIEAGGEESVADVLVSDRPLDPGAPDALGLRRIAMGLSRFLRNESTTAPLTLAITGEWGTGKSSLMNLLRADLTATGFRPVWFNAWHHQKEEHLLASLLQSVRLQAVPPSWRWRGLVFRARLLWIRGRQQVIPLALLLVALVGALGFELSPSHKAHPTVAQAFGQVKDIITSFFTGAPAPARSPDTAPLDLPQIAVLVSAVAALRTLQKGLQAFGVNPAALLATAVGTIKLRDLEAQTSFRQKFAGDFADVTRALGSRSMMIFVDDLDRCRPDRVVEVLEAINFLVSSGDCYVILGMARDKVEPSVALSFKDIAEEMRADGEAPAAAEAPALLRERRASFARHYLDKLINIEVPVPATTEPQAVAILATASVPPGRSPAARAVAAVRGAAPLALLVLALAGGWMGGRQLAHVTAGAEDRVEGRLAHTAPAGGGTTPAAAPTLPPPPALADAQRPGPDGARAARDEAQTGRLLPGRDATSWPWGLLLAAAIVAGLGVLVHLALERPDPVIRDSKDFKDALAIWNPVLFRALNTPRSLKRFLNRVRYLAMRERRERVSWVRSVLSRLLPVAFPPPEEPEAGPTIPEDVLVALAALHQLDPTSLESADKLGMASLSEPVASARKHHEDRFQTWQALATHREAFLRRVVGIRVN
jgi:hypothetical protein